jgi:hypothetical protein
MPISPEGYDSAEIERQLAYPESEQHIQEKLGRFKRGQRVNFRRASGRMEDDWMITGYNEEEDKIILMQISDPSKTSIQKAVRKEDLESWNPE